MAATKTVPQRAKLRKSAQITVSPIQPRHGVVTLFGYRIRVRVDRGHLILEDGIADERREGRFARVRHGLERLVVIGADGMVSLAALRWLADQNAAFVMLERDGSVLAVTGPVRPSDARLRRAQGRADLSGAALVIARELILRKLASQERIVREAFLDDSAAQTIGVCRAELETAISIEDVRRLEAYGAQVYWSVWHGLPVIFPKSDLRRVPEHWRTFDARKSPLSGSPRLAVNPPNAMLNYTYSVLEAESRLALAALGLDPGLGFIHADERVRDNLACDLMEAVRPQVDSFVLDWITKALLKREWFFEQPDGNCRLMPALAEKLSETAPIWRQALAPVAEWIAQTLWSSVRKPERRLGPATPLTQRRMREAKGGDPMPRSTAFPVPQNLCRTCGSVIRLGLTYCKRCCIAFSTEQVVKGAPLGWIATQTANAQAQRAETQKRHNAEIRNWNPATKPAWLTEEVYRRKIQPRLKDVRTSDISSALSVTWPYAAGIRKGKRLPHPRHWQKLSELVEVTSG